MYGTFVLWQVWVERAVLGCISIDSAMHEIPASGGNYLIKKCPGGAASDIIFFPYIVHFVPSERSRNSQEPDKNGNKTSIRKQFAHINSWKSVGVCCVGCLEKAGFILQLFQKDFFILRIINRNFNQVNAGCFKAFL